MFTGIIESLGTIKRIEPKGEGRVMHVACGIDLKETRTGDSIAVNGACLTVTGFTKGGFIVDMAPETVDRTNFKYLGQGSPVNIERALKLSDRIDGHLVSGHIDGTGTIASISKRSNAVIVSIDVPFELAADMIEKGSVAVDGISLTINKCMDTGFEVSIIPHTARITTIGQKKTGDKVNIETDMLGKYVKKILSGARPSDGSVSGTSKDISMELLAKNGFL